MKRTLRGGLLLGLVLATAAFAADAALGPATAAALCRARLQKLDAEIFRRLHPVRLDLDQETSETVEKAEALARYLGSKGEDQLEEKLLEEARKQKIVVEVSGASEFHPREPKIYISRDAVREGGERLRKEIRHELGHILFQSKAARNTDVPELIFFREVDAHLWAGESYESAVYLTFRNYAGLFKNKLDRYVDPQRPRDFMTTARNIRAAFPNQVNDYQLLREN